MPGTLGNLPSPGRGWASRAGTHAGRYESFFVRIWHRRGGSFHGQITHISTRKTTRFASLEHMLAFIAARLQLLPVEPATELGARLSADLSVDTPAAEERGGSLP